LLLLVKNKIASPHCLSTGMFPCDYLTSKRVAGGPEEIKVFSELGVTTHKLVLQ